MSDSTYILFTSVGSLQQPGKVLLVPNPVANEFTIYGLALAAGDLVTITDAVGKTVYQKQVEQNTINYQCTGYLSRSSRNKNDYGKCGSNGKCGWA